MSLAAAPCGDERSVSREERRRACGERRKARRKSDALSFVFLFLPRKLCIDRSKNTSKKLSFFFFASFNSREEKKQTMLASARPRAPLAHAAPGRGRRAVRAAAAAPTPPPSPKKKEAKKSAPAAAAALISSASLAASFVTPLASHAAAAAAPEAAVDGAVNSVVEVVKVRVF